MRTISLTTNRTRLASLAAAFAVALTAMAAGSEPAGATPASSSVTVNPTVPTTTPDSALDQTRKVCRRVLLPDGRVVYRCIYVTYTGLAIEFAEPSP